MEIQAVREIFFALRADVYPGGYIFTFLARFRNRF